jgi:hypothetical protein
MSSDTGFDGLCTARLLFSQSLCFSARASVAIDDEPEGDDSVDCEHVP